MLSGAPGQESPASTMVFAGGGSATVIVAAETSLTGQSQQCSSVLAKFERAIAAHSA